MYAPECMSIYLAWFSRQEYSHRYTTRIVFSLSLFAASRTCASWRHFATIRIATWQVFKCTVRSYPLKRDKQQESCLASAFSGAVAAAASSRRRSSVSSTFPAPTFTAACFSFSFLCAATGQRRRYSFSGNARRSPEQRERESLVLQSRNGGPEGRSSVTLTDSSPIYARIRKVLVLFSLCPFRSFGKTAFPSYRRRRRRHLPAALRISLFARASSTPFCESEPLVGGLYRRTFSGVHVPWD